MIYETNIIGVIFVFIGIWTVMKALLKIIVKIWPGAMEIVDYCNKEDDDDFEL